MSFAATWMDLKIVILREISQTQKDKYCMISLICEIKKGTNELIYKTEVDTQMQKTNLWLPGDKRKGGINWEIGTDICTLLYIKQITNKNLLYSTGNSTQYSVMAYMVKESKNERRVDICICITDSLCCIPKLTHHCKSTRLQ